MLRIQTSASSVQLFSGSSQHFDSVRMFIVVPTAEPARGNFPLQEWLRTGRLCIVWAFCYMYKVFIYFI